MENDYDKIEEDLKQKDEPKKEVKKSGRSVFKLQEIIKKKSQKAIPAKGGSPDPDINRDLGRDSGDNRKTVAGDE